MFPRCPTLAAGSSDKVGHTLRARVIEDIREVSIELLEKGYACDRLTHKELMASTGEEYTGSLLRGDYSVLWISTTSDWYVHIPEIGQLLIDRVSKIG